MQYCRFLSAEGPRYAHVAEIHGQAFPMSPMMPPEEDLVAQRVQERSPAKAETMFSLRDMARMGRLLTPVTPSKIICVGRNYRDHATELGHDVPTEPVLFMKPPSSLLASGGTVRMPAMSKRVDFEGELTIVIGKRARNIGAYEGVRQYIRGYTCLNDVTARDVQKGDSQFTRGKGFDTFCPVGPVVSDEIDPVNGSISLLTRVNGEVKQRGDTKDFLFDIPYLMRYISAVMTLEPGDIIATGTPAGVAGLKDGDVVEVEIPGIGVLSNGFMQE